MGSGKTGERHAWPRAKNAGRPSAALSVFPALSWLISSGNWTGRDTAGLQRTVLASNIHSFYLVKPIKYKYLAMFPASAYTGIVKRGIQKTIWQRRRGNIVTKPGILLLSMVLVSCMLLTACADSSASPAGAKDRISRSHPARSAAAPQLRQPKSGNCWFASQ